MKRTITNERGTSFPEAIMVVGILAIITMAAFTVFRSSQTAAVKVGSQIEVQQEARIGFTKIVKELREARKNSVIISNSGGTIEFTKIFFEGTTVRNDVVRYTCENGKIWRYFKQDGAASFVKDSKPLISNVINADPFNLAPGLVNVVRVSVTLSQQKASAPGAKISLESYVWLRNPPL